MDKSLPYRGMLRPWLSILWVSCSNRTVWVRSHSPEGLPYPWCEPRTWRDQLLPTFVWCPRTSAQVCTFGPWYPGHAFCQGAWHAKQCQRPFCRFSTFSDMFRDPDNMLHAASAFMKPRLAHREYSLFFKEVLKPLFNYAQVCCEDTWPVAFWKVIWFYFFWDDGFLPSVRGHSRLRACLVEPEERLCHRLWEPTDHMVGDRIFPCSLTGWS